jgi:hypothetical protein
VCSIKKGRLPALSLHFHYVRFSLEFEGDDLGNAFFHLACQTEEYHLLVVGIEHWAFIKQV